MRSDRPRGTNGVDAVCQPRSMGVALFHGSDESLVGEAVAEHVRHLVGDGDRALMVEDHGAEQPMAAIVESAETPSMFTDRRIIVLRAVSARPNDDLVVLAAYLREANDDTDLVIEWGSTRIPKVINDALKACGGQSIDPSPPTKAKDRLAWWKTTIEASGITFQPAAERVLIDWLGEDVARFAGLAETLTAAFGDRTITVADLQPFLGERGDSKPWDLTDAIDAGDAETALMVVRRLTEAGERHPLQILAQLHGHFGRLARLDGVAVTSPQDAESVLGLKGFPAEKALKSYRGLGSSGVRRAYGLLAAADRDLRGGSGLDEDVVLDVLVARLAKLTRTVSRKR